MVRFAASPVLARVTAIYSSGERKAVDTARILSERTGIPFSMVAALHENDRSATGYLPPDQFEAVADRFFAEPETSVLGWERAVDAQCSNCRMHPRNRGAGHEPGDIVIAAHGGVGALCWRISSGTPSAAVSINPDPAVATFSLGDARLWNWLHGWQSIDVTV